MSEVLVVKLLNDCDVLAEVTDLGDVSAEITLKNPCVVQFAPPAQGSHEARLALVPYLPYADGDTITIKKSLILFTFKPVVDVLNRYNKIFGSGLIVVGSNIQKP